MLESMCRDSFAFPCGNAYQLTVPFMTPPKIAAGVAFEPEVLEFLSRICAEFQRDRSFVINAIIRDYAQQQQLRPRKRERAIPF
jgi:hypothetical protein